MEEVRKVVYGNEIFTPIFRGSQMLSLEKLRILAVEPAEDAPRFAQCILITTERPARGQWTALPARIFDVPQDVRLVFADSGLAVATITHVESADDADVGPCLVATAKFLPTRLGEICYRAMCNGILSGCCCVIVWGTHIATGRAMGLVKEIRLGAIEDSCLPSAKIWPISTNRDRHSSSTLPPIPEEVFSCRERSEACPEEDRAEQ